MRKTLLFYLVLTASSLFSQSTYYSRNATSGGNWNAAASWTLSSDGSGGAASVPGRSDNVVILSGHNINITATNNNGSTGVSPDGLNYPNVGTFAQSGTACFYQTGNITVNSGGSITSTTRLMFEGYNLIDGTLTSTGDIVNIGKLIASSGAALSTDDDLVLTGTSKTVLDNTFNSDDDLYIDHTEATLCGDGVMNVGVSSPNTPVISYTNSATVAQICAGFIVTCGPGAGCSGFPVSGTGVFSLKLSGYNYYKYLTINSSQVPGDLTNFPVLISFSDPDIRTLADGGHVENSNGYDIVFSSTSNCGQLTQLDHELESYSSNITTGTIVAWVKIPALSSSTNTEIFIYYGNDSVSTDLSVTSVFDYDYTAVYHLDGNFNDATVYGSNGTNSNTAALASAKIASGRTFSANDYIQIPTSNMLSGSGTYSIWAYSSSFSTNHQYLVGHTTTPPYANRLQLYTNDAAGNLDLGFGSNHNLSLGIYDFNTSEWYHVALTWNSGTYDVFVNGASQSSSTYASFTTLQTFMDIGNDGNAATRNESWIGDIDEVKCSKIARSANWLATEYNSQNSPSTFFTVGAELSNACIALPIELTEFKVFPIDKKVAVEWTTVSEINNDFFTIERSKDTKNWENVSTIKGAGNSRQLIKYKHSDEEPFSGRSYYRLKQTDYDGKFAYSKIGTVNFNIHTPLIVYPNPTGDVFYISGSGVINPNEIKLYDIYQHEAFVKFSHTGQEISVDVSNLESGIYFLKYSDQINNQMLKVVVRK